MEEAINCAMKIHREPKIMSPGEVIVKLQAAALNHIDVWTLLTNAQLQPGESLLMIGIGGGIAQRIPPSRQKIDAQVIVTSGTHESCSGQGN
jgi:D-arabinose 1-dehydrogenase-like Zn-dependent alcohol dehydrogenase